ncbi:DnaA ATPase domain-containing protein [Thalassococcus sp. S3]|uniref:DnaA ATPase domain-containing protein n=1 Tax=Thalassococcus sp. S3 TaxID=2017482 RepID=UPI00102456CD|nr:DnaA/Hda family protein [Thalassococcus sp. S3]QBF32840.1 chromosomal replication initiator DnaA [Thalassococcus sp. S3]
MSKQTSFDLSGAPALAREDFFVSPCNAVAVAMIDAPQTWPSGKLALTGPAGSGKTHLAQIWATENNARLLPATNLTEGDISYLAQGSVAVEDVPALSDDLSAQKMLFHLHNLVLANGHRLLLTGRPAPKHWALSLPDLQSRIEGAQHAALQEPDDQLLGAVLGKLFADRQILPKPDVIPYLVSHMDRSFAAAGEIVDRLDRTALDEKRSLNRALAIRLLAP